MKIIRLPNEPASGKNNGNGKVNKFGDNSIKYIKKSEKSKKLSKSKKSKSEKLAKSKKLSKSRIPPNFDVKETGLTFLTFGAIIAFNCLWLTFIKALIL